MAEQQQVELDTDGIDEKDIQVEQDSTTEKEKPELEPVDLGYSDPIKQDIKAEVQKEIPLDKSDNLEQVSDTVQKRINQLTRKMREAERREKAALDYAKGLQTKYNKAEKDKNVVDESFVKEYETRVDAQTEQVKQKLKTAMESQDYDSMMTANQELTALAVEKEKAKMRKEQLEQQKTEAEELAKQQPQQQPIPQQEPSEKAKAWADENTWFGQDKVMTNAAYTIHTDLVQKGFDPESDDYYTEVNKQMRENFPNKFAEERPVQTVASAGRKQQGRRTVKLTRSQVAIARKLGVPLEEYAKHVKG
tara:strand:+ start:39 stop:956 length:918 start_codon:yes stop_codon:yes gene_type:complete